jgi:hypothetical protein
MLVEASPSEVAQHPATRVWTSFQSSARMPTRISVLKNTPKSAVYRLEGAVDRGTPLVAKQCRTATARTEIAVYETILPQLPLTALRYYGSVIDDEGCWLFLEDAGGVRLSLEVAEHRIIAARWLAVMHISSTGIAPAARLPARGTPYYLAQLHTARDRLLELVRDVPLGVTDRRVLEAIVSQCDVLHSRWDRLEECCENVPCTLVHGDFRPKNVRLRDRITATELLAIDWETAGQGTPAVDLASARARPVNVVDIPTYYSMVRRCWPWLDARTVMRLIAAGWIFRRLTAIAWDALKVSTPWPQRALAAMRVYQSDLEQAIRGSGWIH